VAKAKQRPTTKLELRNPYEGLVAARQLDESVDEFLKRIPVQNHPSIGPWIWIANFHSKGKSFNEDSADTGFIKKGQALLKGYDEKKLQMENEGLTPLTVTRRLGPARQRLKEEILQTATECGIVCGKVRNLNNYMPIVKEN
jgi:Bles03-like protein